MRTAIAQAGGLASRFLAWWLGELGALTPGVLRRAFTGGRGVLGFEIDGDELVVGRTSNGTLEEVARLDMRQPGDALSAAVAGVLRKHAPRGTDIVLVLGAEQALHKILDLPLVAEEGLRDLLYFELDRQTPYRPDQVRYDFRVVGRDPAAGRMQVELLVAPVEAVEGLMARAAEWGLEPTAVTVAGLDDAADPVFDLSGEAPAAPRARHRVLAALALIEGREGPEIEALFDGARFAPPPLEEAERALLAALAPQAGEAPAMPAPITMKSKSCTFRSPARSAAGPGKPAPTIAVPRTGVQGL